VRPHLAPIAVALLCFCPTSVNASAIVFSDPYFRSWNGVIVHRPGDAFSSFALMDEVVTAGPDAQLANDLGFASVAATAQPLSLHPASAVDGTAIGAFGYDYVVAEATTWYETDFRIVGGAGAVDVLLEVSQSEVSFSDEPGSAYPGMRSISILYPPYGGIFGMSSRADSGLVELQYDTTYRLQMIFAAYRLATLGHQASIQRDLELSLTIVPEPQASVLLALGLAFLGIRRRRARRCG
jgi:hypothetical protein